MPVRRSSYQEHHIWQRAATFNAVPSMRNLLAACDFVDMNSYQAKRLRLQLFRERRSRELSEKTSFRMPTHWTQLFMLEEAIHTNGARRARLKLWYAQAEVCMERKAAADDSLCCSFCGKQSVGKLIPSPFARASICDQCIAVSAGIIEDDRLASQDSSSRGIEFVYRHPFLEHPLVSQLLEAVESWVHEESMGNQELIALSRMRTLAKQIAQDVSGTTNKLA